MSLAEITGLIGRDAELTQLRHNLKVGKHTLLLAPGGYGKTTLLRYLHAEKIGVDSPHMWIGAGNTARNTVMDLAKICHEAIGLTIPKSLYLELPPRTRTRFERNGKIEWKDLNRPVGRLTVAEINEVIVGSLSSTLPDKKFTFFIENLKCVPQLASFYERLFQCSHVFACLDVADQRRTHLQPLISCFMEKIELKPLPLEPCRQVAEKWLEVNPVRFVDEKTRRAFIQHVARDSGGIPISIEGMLENARTLDEITMNKVRELSHDAAVQYFDMSYVLFGLLVGFMALRYVSRGVGETELMVLSGVGSAVMIGFFYVMRFLRSPEKR